MINDENNNYIDVESSPVNDNGSNVFDNQFKYEDGNISKKKRRRGILGRVAGCLLLTVTGGLFGGGITYSLIKNNVNGGNGLSINKQVNYVPQSFTQSDSQAMTAADAFNKVSPAVVIISTVGTTSNGFTASQYEGMGSGFIINEEGYILTNYHVIEGAKDITVTLSDGNEVPGTVVNYDQEKDLAMIKLKEGTKVPAVAELGDSDELYPGAEVIAIGTPLSKNLAYTLTKGIISGNDRTIQTQSGTSVHLLQTDAAINSGNSGGPLVNTKGQVIGINSMKLGSQSTGSATVEGIGFAIPINEVKSKIDTLSKQILNLGIKIREIDSTTAQKYDLEQGLYVASVDEYSPAEKGGVKIGDIIVDCDGKQVKTFDELKEIKQSKDVGDTMTMKVIRDKKTIDLSIVLEESK